MTKINIQKFFGLLAGLIALCFLGCSEDEKVVASYYGDVCYSPSTFHAEAAQLFRSRMKSARLVLLNDRLDSVGVVNMDVQRRWDYYWEDDKTYFDSREIEFPSPYVKVVTSYYMDDSSDVMEFSQYDLVTESVDRENQQNLFDALAFDRITVLVQDEKMDFEKARSQAYEELAKAMGIDSVYYAVKSTRTHDGYILPYFYCRHFVNDSVFYSDFKELRSLFAKRSSVPDSIKTRISDDLFRRYMIREKMPGWLRMEFSHRDTAIYFYDLQWGIMTDAYHLKSQDAVEAGDIAEIKNELSQFNGVKVVYDSLRYPGPGWRRTTELEDSIGTCLNFQVEVKESQGQKYYCAYHFSGWIEVGDQEFKLDAESCNDATHRAEERLGNIKFRCDCVTYRYGCLWVGNYE